MTDATFTDLDVAPFDHGPLSQRHSTWTIAGAGAVTLGVLVGSWLLDHRAVHNPFGLEPGAARLATAFRAPPPGALPDLPRAVPSAAAAKPAPEAPPSPEAAAVPALAVESPRGLSLLDPGFARGPAPVALADSAPLDARFVAAGPVEAPRPGPAVAAAEPDVRGPDVAAIAPRSEEPHDAAPSPPLPPSNPVLAELRPQVETVPLPTPRPAFPWSVRDGNREGRRQMARLNDAAPAPAAPGPAAPAAPADNRGFLEKFFGAFKPSGSALGYAAPEDGLFGRPGLPGGPATPRDRYTAVYDISAHTVYLPDGTRLEAHSGLGRMLDDPRSVTARNTGATPPHLYDLTLREAPFHGVQALRLNPVGGGGVYGRNGLLAHTYMLGPNGQSNGCVSFRDYAAFLRAYQNGQVRRLVVVAGGMN